MIKNDRIPQPVYIVTTSEQIKAYVHPTRQTLLKFLSREKRTISGMAKELGVHPANITHHVKLLEKAGLICLVEKIDTGRNVEKYYRAIAESFVVQSDEIGIHEKKAMALSILRSNLDVAIEKIKKSPDRDILTLLETVKLSSADFKWLMEKISLLINELEKKESADGESYTINLGVYPSEGDITSNSEDIIIT